MKAAFLWRHRFLALPANLKARGAWPRRNRRDFFPEVLQGATGAGFRDGPKNGAAEPPNEGSPRNIYGPSPGGKGKVGRDPMMRSFRRMTNGEALAVLRPLLARNAVLCSGGGGKGPIALAAREMGMAHRAVNPRKGIRVLAGGHPHPECERLPFALEGMDAMVPWGRHKVSGPLRGLASHDRDIWRASQLRSLVDFISWSL